MVTGKILFQVNSNKKTARCKEAENKKLMPIPALLLELTRAIIFLPVR